MDFSRLTPFMLIALSVACGREPSAASESPTDGTAANGTAANGAAATSALDDKDARAPTVVAPRKAPEPIPMSVKATGQLGPGRGTLIVDIKAPEGAELTEGAPFRVSARGADLTFPEEINTKLDLKKLPVRLPLEVADGAQGPVEMDLTYYYCTKGDDGSCRPERAKLSVEVDMNGGSEGGEAHLIHRPGS